MQFSNRTLLNYYFSPNNISTGHYAFRAGAENSSWYINRYTNVGTNSGDEVIAYCKVNGDGTNGVAETPYNSTSGTFRVRRSGTTAYDDFWNGTQWITLLSRTGIPTSPAWVDLWTVSQVDMPTVKVDVDSFYTDAGKYATRGTLTQRLDAGLLTRWGAISWSSTEPSGSSIKFRTRSANTESDLSTASWSNYLTASGSPVTSLPGRWIEIEATLSTTDNNITPLLHDVTITYGNNPGDILWQTDVSLSLAQGALSNYTSNIGTLGNGGKYYLQGVVTSNTGQTVATYDYPFFVAQGNTALSFSPNKRVYRPGETVTISGEVKNLGTVTASNLSLVLKSKVSGGTGQTMYSEIFSIPAGGSHPFTVTISAGAEGTVTITGVVTQNASTLAEVADQFEVAVPQVSPTVTLPDVVGNDPFTITVEMQNTGKTDAAVSYTPSTTSRTETITVPAGQKQFFQYVQQITADASYTFAFSGDLNQTLSRTVKYGLAGTVAATAQAMYPEGKISIPVAISNTGFMDGRFTVDYQLTQAGNTLYQYPADYYLPKTGNSADTLSFDLTEGAYQLTATGQLPTVSASTSFSVRKQLKVELSFAVGSQTGETLPVTIAVTNLGFSQIDGSVRVSLVGGDGSTAWSSAQDVTLPRSLAPAPQSMASSINLAPLKPGFYTIKAELLDTANQQLAQQSAPFTLLGAVFDMTQLPPYQTVPAGGSGTMTFKVKNNGNQEGDFALSFKADDLIDSTRVEWLKPGEEKEIPFIFQTATDLEEKDYTATYRLKSGGTTIKEGVVAYHVTGIKLSVTSALDKQSYNVGDTAAVTLTIAREDAGSAPNLFARVNYNGYEEKQDFTLNGTQTLTFRVPLSQITGEKLFYGIYHQSGRSLYLNTTYIYKADNMLALTTDKQVYNPGETVNIAITGTTTGDLALTGPGDFSNALAFTGLATRSFVLPSDMTAGTYYLNAQLKAQSSDTINVKYPFDVAGMQVKVKEALLDKAKYASTDTMNLSLTIESNVDIPATVRTWVVDPAGAYTDAGSGNASLTPSNLLIANFSSTLSTNTTGIHKLVYGIYKGDLLLASGAKAFDIGEAVLVGFATDKSDYPELSSPIAAKAELYGSTDVGLEFFLDGTSIKTATVTVSGFSDYSFILPPESLTPGRHTLKAVLTAIGLTSTRETGFTCGSSLPDLVVRLVAENVKGSSLPLTATVTNQGKTASVATTVALYEGDPAQGGTPIASLSVPALAPGAAGSVTYAWNVIGIEGDKVIYAVADPANAVTEFVEANNRTLTTISLPKLTLGVSTTGASFNANSNVGIPVGYANLSSSSLYQDLVLRVELANPQGVVSLLKETAIASLAPSTEATEVINWNTTTSLPGSYSIKARLLGGGTTLLESSAAFVIEPTLAVTGTLGMNNHEIRQGSDLIIFFSLKNSGNVGATGMVRAVITEPQTGAVKTTAEQTVDLPVNASNPGEFSFSTQGLELKSYSVSLQYVSMGTQVIIGDSSFTIKDGTPPIVRIASPQAGAAYNAAITIAALATDDASGVEKVEYQIDEGGWNILILEDAATGRYSTSLQPATPDNGSHTIRFRATDKAQNTTLPVLLTFTFDSVSPILTVSTLVDGAYTNNDTLNIAGTVHDAVGFGVLRINDVVVSVSADGGFSYPLILNKGDNTVTTVATDLADNQTTDTRRINLDQTAPLLTVTAPADNSKTGSQLMEVKGTVGENAAVEVKVQDDDTNAAMDGTAFTATVGLEPGLNTIEIIATDLAGNQNSQKRTVLYDDKKPALSITEPSQDIRTNRSSIMVKGTASDPMTAVGVIITVDADMFTPTVVNGVFEQTVSFTEEKQYSVNITATNEVGTQVSAQRNIIYDKTPPVLTINPVSSPTNRDNQLVTGTREEGVSVTLSCAKALVGEITYTGATSWQALISNLADGENVISAFSTDIAGNAITAVTKIVYVEKAPDLKIAAAPGILWPPNRKMVPVKLEGEAVPHGAELQSVSISVADEYGKYSYSNLKFGATIMLEAWRDGSDLNGRVYTITAVATDKAGNTTTKTATVTAPHDAR